MSDSENSVKTTTTNTITTTTTTTNINTTGNDLLSSMKPMLNDIMGIMGKYSYKTNEDNDSDSDDPIMNEVNNNKVTENKVDETFSQAINETLNRLGPIFKDIDKYKDKPHLNMMPYIFTILSKIESSESEPQNEIQRNSSIICELLKDKDILELYEENEFQEAVKNVTINYNKMLIELFRKSILELETNLGRFDENTSVDTYLHDLHDKFSKKK